jgi:hypothetical protein
MDNDQQLADFKSRVSNPTPTLEDAGIDEAGVDLWMLEVGSEKGSVVEVPGSVHKIARYPFLQSERQTFPSGTLKITRSEKEVAVDLPDFHLVCKDDKTWHYDVNDKKRNVRLEMIHHGVGYPTWYGRRNRNISPHTASPTDTTGSAESKALSPSRVGRSRSKALPCASGTLRSIPVPRRSAVGKTGCGSTSTRCSAVSTR